MENLLETLWQAIYSYLNIGYILALILSSNVLINKAKIQLLFWKGFEVEGRTVYAVLIWATLISIPWVVRFLMEDRPGDDYMKLFISYCVATSIYEIFIKKFLSGNKTTQ